MIGTIAHMGVRQGAALIINIFLGTVLNGGFGIASQIYNYTMMFGLNLNQVAVPLLLSTDSILLIWLKKVPEFTKQFTVLMIINGLISMLGSGFDAVIQATGKIRKTQIWYSIITLSGSVK